MFGHTGNASRDANRWILLIGGWDGSTAPIETVLLPFYRARKRQPSSEVTITAYPEDTSLPLPPGYRED